MCCCGKPVINGQLGYRWQPSDNIGVFPINAPEIGERDELLYDEPGRCGRLDSHCHHYRVVKNCGLALLVKHGGGTERVRLTRGVESSLAALGSDDRYWILSAIYHAHADANLAARDRANAEWRKAAAEKRIRTRKNSRAGTVKVWIETGA